ncbi:hypothetical protein H2200_005102 [Cladophialophora chaetospira]|uniref:Methyltransferase OMS1, mitochondrial n=1 Tax=Cladophialophora chaetospira TaxID=386627 RepID=A0AA38XBC7_9EURO|nr:hypothetical protein H2200_005102 [Cladophialophora chaetospira]
MGKIALQSLQKSRIPHLALSISTKRASAQSKSRCLNQQNTLPLSSRCYNSLSRRIAKGSENLDGSKTSFRRHASTTSRPGPTLPASQPQSHPQHKPRPTLAQRASAEEVLRQRRAIDARKRIHMSSNTYFWICSLFGFALSTYIVYTYMSYSRSLKEYEGLDLPQNADVSSRWLDKSRQFDDEVELSEKFMGLRNLREHLCREARGNVLEVSAGTGRNMGLYRLDPMLVREEKKVKSLVFNDLSEIMLLQAQKKFEEAQEKIAEEKRSFSGPVQFVVGDASERTLIQRPEGGFDTIVQTMGICSETNPVAFLKRLAELCRQPGEKSTGMDVKVIEKEAQERLEDLQKTKDYGAAEPEQEGEQLDALIVEAGGDLGGKILLLEHGRSTLGVVNRILDNGAKMHADHYGCWWNKDIEQVVKDSGLIVERKRRYHFGTTYEYVLRPRPRSKPDEREVLTSQSEIEGAVVDLSEGVKAKSWGSGWFSRG